MANLYLLDTNVLVHLITRIWVPHAETDLP